MKTNQANDRNDRNIREIALYATEQLKKSGADKSSCIAKKMRRDEFNIEANKFTLMRTTFDDSLVLTAIVGGRRGVSVINKHDRASIDAAATDCIALAKSGEPDDAFDIAEFVENKDFIKPEITNDRDGLFARSREYIEQVRDEFPKIIVEGFSATLTAAEEAYVNSNGVTFGSQYDAYNFHSMFVAKDGEKGTSFNYDGATFTKPNTAFLDAGMHRTLLEEAVKSLDTRMVEEKFTGKIIVTPACTDMLWGTITDNFLADRALIEGTSRWKDALGTQVADKKLTFRAAPLAEPHIITGPRWTSDGYITRDVDFISGGVLKSFALGLYGARKTGKPRADTSTYHVEVMPGDVALADIIKSTPRGILLNRFSGGSPGASGDISGVAKNSFLIENGAITDALQETMISFNILDALKNIAAISRERVTNGTTHLPWVCLDGITVSGK
ncbi:MAG: TldD/PmbA family protein [Defluviitaleaceae bacterium]|nr:TldD/PmbA family protein [Defluviitaleaceae bacterium]